MLLIFPVSSKILVIIFVITPSLFTFTGGEIYIGVVKLSDDTSISLSVPIGIDLLLQVIFSKLTTLKLVQSI